MTDPLEGLAVVGSQALRRTTLATLYNGVQRKKIQKILQRRSASRAASGRRSDGGHERWCWAEGHVWAGIYGFDSVFDGPGRFALDRADLRQKYDDLRRFAPFLRLKINAR
mgnify:CR=1 FL=1